MDNNESRPVNTPQNWQEKFPHPRHDGNKYDRGHAIILGGDSYITGATKLAAYAALRAGAGLVSVACNSRSLPAYAASFQAVMTKPVENLSDFAALIGDVRVTAILLGPGAGINDFTKSCVLEALKTKKPVVLDADALSVFSQAPELLFKKIQSTCVITPHEGEFSRLFANIIDKKKNAVERSLQAAAISGAIVVLKGENTVITSPDGKYFINTNATPYLATAGSGDVLAGICTGLLAQSMPAFEAACAAVWLHGEAANNFGAGLIAEDIADQLPLVLNKLVANHII